MKVLVAVVVSLFSFCASAQVKESKLVVDASDLRIKINKNIYGQFSEHLGHRLKGAI